MTKPSPSLRILVVDDDSVLIDLIPWLLSVLGHTVETAGTGELALLRLSRPPLLDVVLTDLHMPGMDGATLAETIAVLPHPPRLIGMSGSEPTAEQAIHFSAFLHKPFGIEGLIRVLKNFQPQPDVEPAVAVPLDPIILDTVIYDRLAASMPHAKLQDLYNRTLDYVRKTAPSLDTCTEAARAELAHDLHSSCAMVGAVELAILAGLWSSPPHAVLDFLSSPSPGSNISHKILSAADRLEHLLGLLHTF